MKNIYIFIILFLSLEMSYAQQTKKVLFLGNSYTAVNNLPDILQQMAAERGHILEYETYTPGGYRFLNHAADPTTLQKIQAEDWDFVVLQGQSQETAFPENMLANEIYPPVATLTQAIRENNPCAVPLFYMTWGRKNGDPQNCPYAEWFCTYETMDDVINETYNYLATTNESDLAPIGAIWRFLREQHPEIELYSSDESHPSLAGSYAAAAGFYTMIFRENPTEIQWNSTLPTNHAETIKMAAETVAFNHPEDWTHSPVPTADFDPVITEHQVDFNNQSTNFDQIWWDFGDGNSSEEENPAHIYETFGDYTVTLKITYCQQVDSISKIVSIEDLAADQFSFEKVSIFPNPTTDYIHISGSREQGLIAYELYDLSGKVIFKHAFSNRNIEKLDVSGLTKGIYFLNIQTEHQNFPYKVIKK